jgi:hypothetical protein
MDTQALLEHLKAARGALLNGQARQALIWLEAVQAAGYMVASLDRLVQRISLSPEDPGALDEIDAILGRITRAEVAVDAIEALEELPDGEDWFDMDDAPIEGMEAPSLDLGVDLGAELFSDLDANSSPEAIDFAALEPLEGLAPAQSAQPTLAGGLFDAIDDLDVSDDPNVSLMLEDWDLGPALSSPAISLTPPAPVEALDDLDLFAQPVSEPTPAEPDLMELAPKVPAPAEPEPAAPAYTAPELRITAPRPALGASLFDEEEDDPFLDASRPLEARSQPEVEGAPPASQPGYTFFDALSQRGASNDFLPDLDPEAEQESDILADLGNQQSTRQGDEDLSLAVLLAREPAPAERGQEPSFALDSFFDELELGFLPEAHKPVEPEPPAPKPTPAPSLDLLNPPTAEDAGFEWGGSALFPDLPAGGPIREAPEALSSPGSMSKNPKRWITQPPAAMTAEEEDFGDVTRIPGLAESYGAPAALPAPAKKETPPTIEHSYEMASSGDDFDLGPSRPVSQPASSKAHKAEDDFDFDLGPSRPSYQVAASPLPAPQPTPAPPQADEDEFDFDLGFNMPQSVFAPPVTPQEHSSSSSIRLTPAAPQESISSFERQKTPPSGSYPQAREEAQDVSEDEFFALAESLAPSRQPAAAGPRPYRGEPMVRRNEPTPSPEPKRQLTGNIANPFAHDAPTGVRKALVDASAAESASQVSFVLEEIEPADELHSSSQIRKLYDEGKISQAWSRVETVATQEPDNTEVRQLRQKIEQEMERIQLRRLGPLSRTPLLNVAPSALSTLNLDHRSGFLISQIDGTMCFEDILDLSSMSRLETLMVLADLLDKQVIKAS